ncbi:MAG: hypothetical protein ACRD0G_17670 [Acidimicrobiales bacterium]
MLIAAYHQQQLRALLEQVRDGFARLDTGEIDEFDLDDLIHRYKRGRRRPLEVLRFNGWAMATSGEHADLRARARRRARLVDEERSASQPLVLSITPSQLMSASDAYRR